MGDGHRATCDNSVCAPVQHIVNTFARNGPHRYPKVWVGFAQVDVGLLPNAMCGVYNSQNVPLTTEGHHLFPWKINARIGGDAIDDSHNLQLGPVTDLLLRTL